MSFPDRETGGPTPVGPVQVDDHWEITIPMTGPDGEVLLDGDGNPITQTLTTDELGSALSGPQSVLTIPGPDGEPIEVQLFLDANGQLSYAPIVNGVADDSNLQPVYLDENNLIDGVYYTTDNDVDSVVIDGQSIQTDPAGNLIFPEGIDPAIVAMYDGFTYDDGVLTGPDGGSYKQLEGTNIPVPADGQYYNIGGDGWQYVGPDGVLYTIDPTTGALTDEPYLDSQGNPVTIVDGNVEVPGYYQQGDHILKIVQDGDDMILDTSGMTEAQLDALRAELGLEPGADIRVVVNNVEGDGVDYLTVNGVVVQLDASGGLIISPDPEEETPYIDFDGDGFLDPGEEAEVGATFTTPDGVEVTYVGTYTDADGIERPIFENAAGEQVTTYMVDGNPVTREVIKDANGIPYTEVANIDGELYGLGPEDENGYQTVIGVDGVPIVKDAEGNLLYLADDGTYQAVVVDNGVAIPATELEEFYYEIGGEPYYYNEETGQWIGQPPTAQYTDPDGNIVQLDSSNVVPLENGQIGYQFGDNTILLGEPNEQGFLEPSTVSMYIYKPEGSDDKFTDTMLYMVNTNGELVGEDGQTLITNGDSITVTFTDGVPLFDVPGIDEPLYIAETGQWPVFRDAAGNIYGPDADGNWELQAAPGDAVCKWEGVAKGYYTYVVPEDGQLTITEGDKAVEFTNIPPEMGTINYNPETGTVLIEPEGQEPIEVVLEGESINLTTVIAEQVPGWNPPGENPPPPGGDGPGGDGDKEVGEANRWQYAYAHNLNDIDHTVREYIFDFNARGVVNRGELRPGDGPNLTYEDYARFVENNPQTLTYAKVDLLHTGINGPMADLLVTRLGMQPDLMTEQQRADALFEAGILTSNQIDMDNNVNLNSLNPDVYAAQMAMVDGVDGIPGYMEFTNGVVNHVTVAQDMQHLQEMVAAGNLTVRFGVDINDPNYVYDAAHFLVANGPAGQTYEQALAAQSEEIREAVLAHDPNAVYYQQGLESTLTHTVTFGDTTITLGTEAMQNQIQAHANTLDNPPTRTMVFQDLLYHVPVNADGTLGEPEPKFEVDDRGQPVLDADGKLQFNHPADQARWDAAVVYHAMSNSYVMEQDGVTLRGQEAYISQTFNPAYTDVNVTAENIIKSQLQAESNQYIQLLLANEEQLVGTGILSEERFEMLHEHSTVEAGIASFESVQITEQPNGELIAQTQYTAQEIRDNGTEEVLYQDAIDEQGLVDEVDTEALEGTLGVETEIADLPMEALLNSGISQEVVAELAASGLTLDEIQDEVREALDEEQASVAAEFDYALRGGKGAALEAETAEAEATPTALEAALLQSSVLDLTRLDIALSRVENVAGEAGVANPGNLTITSNEKLQENVTPSTDQQQVP